jgi:predicted RNase H-like HicB family nuclease
MKVRDLIKLIEADGWAHGSSERQSSAVQACDKIWPCHGSRASGRRRSGRDAEEYLSASANRGTKEVTYTVIIENAGMNYSAYVPDLLGCITTGAMPEETMCNIREAIELHLEGIREDGDPVPEPSTTAAVIEVAA